jgi:hypothetical protein
MIFFTISQIICDNLDKPPNNFRSNLEENDKKRLFLPSTSRNPDNIEPIVIVAFDQLVLLDSNLSGI